MERLTKSERTGLIVFACAISIFILTVFILNNRTYTEPVDKKMLEQMAQFERKVELVKSDTIMKIKTKKKKKSAKADKADDINPLDDKLEREN